MVLRVRGAGADCCRLFMDQRRQLFNEEDAWQIAGSDLQEGLGRHVASKASRPSAFI